MAYYLIAHIGHTHSNSEHVLWWMPKRCGYTVCIAKAGLYPAQEAHSICADPRCIAVPKAAAELLARSTPYFRRSDGSLGHLYDGAPQRVVPNSLEAWQHLFNECLAYACRPEKPTPIGARARSIYLDTLPV